MTRMGETSKPSTTSIRLFCTKPREKSISCTLPSRRTVSFSQMDSAFTQDTPTPCKPPETL
ncbi:hypothetical protein D3C72_2288190 [compost metagenome]